MKMEPSQDKENQVRGLLYQLEVGRKQLDQLVKQEQMIEGALMEINSTVDALNTLKNQKPGDAIMVQVGAGSFMKAKLEDTENVLVGIGAGMSVEKKIPDAVQALQERRTSLTESLKSLRKTMGELTLRIADLNAQAEKMMGPLA
ncbi:MAG: prefoldin subunit alpha [Candidatus Altiarchaeota archaeon]|nr:prefoldin subunit alpha [Candidatus Altiarchaeota archaeon]